MWWFLQIADLGDSAFALSTIAGSATVLPMMISGCDSASEWRDLPPLNTSKHQSLYVPPSSGLDDIRDLANTVAPGYQFTDQILRELCWVGAGSLPYLVTMLGDLARGTHALMLHA